MYAKPSGFGNINTIVPFSGSNYNVFSHDAFGPNSGYNSNQASFLYGPGSIDASSNLVPTFMTPQNTGTIPYITPSQGGQSVGGNVATSMAPLPSNYNPTGVGGVMGSNAGVENVANIQSFNPAVPVGSAPQVLGTTGAPSPFIPRVNSAAPAPQNFQQPSQFGYPTNIPIPNAANLNPATVGSGSGASVISPELQGALEKTYGAGFGQTLTNVLQQGAGYNPQVANAFIYAAQPYFESNMADLLEKFGVGGQRFGSTAALAAGKMSADFTAQEQQIMAQMYQWAYGNFLNVLSNGRTNTSGNKFDTINSILGLAGDAAGAISEGFGVGGKTGDILDALSKL